MTYERLGAVLNRQRKYSVLDTLLLLVLAVGLPLAALTVVLQLPSVPMPSTQPAIEQPASPDRYTANLLIDAPDGVQQIQ